MVLHGRSGVRHRITYTLIHFQRPDRSLVFSHSSGLRPRRVVFLGHMRCKESLQIQQYTLRQFTKIYLFTWVVLRNLLIKAVGTPVVDLRILF